MYHPIAVAMKRLTNRILVLGPQPSPGRVALRRLRRQNLVLALFQLLAYRFLTCHVAASHPIRPIPDPRSPTSPQNILKKAFAVAERADAEEVGDGLAQVGEGWADTDVGPGTDR